MNGLLYGFMGLFERNRRVLRQLEGITELSQLVLNKHQFQVNYCPAGFTSNDSSAARVSLSITFLTQ